MRSLPHGAAVLAVVILTTVLSTHAHLKKPKSLKNTRPEMWMSSSQLASLRGYSLENHTVRTDDGYILTVHRLYARNSTTPGTTPLLVGHGLCSCDEQWMVRKTDNLIFDLADMGFDIWLSNYRGSFYSQKHETLSPKDHKFWDFSWHENGVLDQAAIIDYVIAKTGYEKIIVMGHSMSSTSQIVLLAERPEYNDKIRANILLAPPVYFKHVTGFLAVTGSIFKAFPLMRGASAAHVINDLFSGLDRPWPQSCYDHFGGYNPKLHPHCMRTISLAMGPLYEPIDVDLLQLIMHHYPAGTSIRQVLHYGQCVDAGGDFRKYDYGPAKNRQLYGTPKPPTYNLTNLNSPVYIHYSPGDGTVNWQDAEQFTKDLRPGIVKRSRKIPTDRFCHIDYIIAKDARELLYKYVIEDLLNHKD